MRIPYERLSIDVLQALIEEFVLREGTEYGERPVSLDDKRAAVLRALQLGEAVITFDPESESTSIDVHDPRAGDEQDPVDF